MRDRSRAAAREFELLRFSQHPEQPPRLARRSARRMLRHKPPKNAPRRNIAAARFQGPCQARREARPLPGPPAGRGSRGSAPCALFRLCLKFSFACLLLLAPSLLPPCPERSLVFFCLPSGGVVCCWLAAWCCSQCEPRKARRVKFVVVPSPAVEHGEF